MIHMKQKYAFIRVRKETKEKLDTWADICDQTLIDMLEDIIDAYRDTILISNINRIVNSPNADDVFCVANEVANSIIAKRDS